MPVQFYAPICGYQREKLDDRWCTCCLSARVLYELRVADGLLVVGSMFGRPGIAKRSVQKPIRSG